MALPLDQIPGYAGYAQREQANQQQSLASLMELTKIQDMMAQRQNMDFQTRMQPLQLTQAQQAIDMHGLQRQQLEASLATQELQRKLAAQFPELIAKLRGGAAPAAVPYQDQVTPEQAGSKKGLPTLDKVTQTPEAFMADAMRIPDPVQRRAVLEAGFRQWPELRPMMQQPAQPGATNRDPQTTFGALGAQMAMSGMKGGDEMIKFAGMLGPRELKGGTTYENPLSGQREFMPSYDKGQRPDGRGGLEAIPGYMDFLRQETNAKVDPVQAAKLSYETGMGVGSPTSATFPPDSRQNSATLPPKVQNEIRQKEAESVAGKSGDVLDASKAGAQTAINNRNTINQIRQSIEGNKFITGKASDARLSLAQWADFLGVGGKDVQEKLENTRAVIRSLANMSVDAAGKIKGQGQVTENERVLLEKAASGKINDLTPVELRTILDISDREAERLYKSHGDLLSRVPQNVPTWAFQAGELPARYGGKAQASGSATTVTTPDGQTYNFPSTAAAQAFKARMGIK